MNGADLNIGEGKYKKLRLADLVTDGRFNRPVRHQHVEKIAADFTPGAFRTIEVWSREDEKYAILDGQHRCEVLRALGYPEDARVVPAIVHEGLTLDQAAELFVKLNASKLVSSYDRFNALRTAGHTKTVDIDRIANSHDLRISNAHHDGTVSAVSALQWSYELGEPVGAVLDQTLETLTTAWGGSTEGLTSALIRGVSLHFHEHRDTDPASLAKAIVRGPGGPVNLIGWAKTVAGSQTMTLPEAIATVIEKRVMKTRRRPKAAGED